MRAGIIVRMCTGDHPATARTIARQCGIPVLHHRVRNGAVMFFEDEDKRVLARSSPEDKAAFVRALQHRKRVVAFLGDGTNDRLALEAADVSFSMAVAGTEVSKASDVVVLDQSFDSISKVRKWGEWLKQSRGQFIDLYVPTSLAIVFLSFVSSLASSTSEPALSFVQILWITLLINPVAVIALSTDKSWLDDGAEPPSSPLPSIYYLVAETLIVLLLFVFGHEFPGHSSTENMANVSDKTRTLIFNTMAFMQIFRTLFYWNGNRRKTHWMLTTNWMFPIIPACGLYHYFGRMF
jgi:Ca2+-transporting ATPase